MCLNCVGIICATLHIVDYSGPLFDMWALLKDIFTSQNDGPAGAHRRQKRIEALAQASFSGLPSSSDPPTVTVREASEVPDKSSRLKHEEIGERLTRSFNPSLALSLHKERTSRKRSSDPAIEETFAFGTSTPMNRVKSEKLRRASFLSDGEESLSPGDDDPSASPDVSASEEGESEAFEESLSMSMSSVKETSTLVRGEDEDGNKMINEYAVLRSLGKGQYGKVKLVVHNDTGGLFAIKILNKSVLARMRKGDETALDDVRREIAIMKRLNHQNIVSLTEVIDDVSTEKMYLIMEYVAKGPITSIRADGSTSSGPLPEEKVRSYLRDMIAGLQYLHHQQVIHRDVKPENILLTKDDQVRIADFGVSTFVTDKEKLTPMAGTPAFLSPEVVREDRQLCGKPVDVWALGITVFALLFGKLPFYSKHTPTLHDAIQNSPIPFPEDCQQTYVKDFFESVLHKDVAQRATLHDLCSHPFVTGCGIIAAISPDESPKLIDQVVTESEMENAVLKASNVQLVDYIALVMKMKVRMNGAARRARAKIQSRALDCGHPAAVERKASRAHLERSKRARTPPIVDLHTSSAGNHKAGERKSRQALAEVDSPPQCDSEIRSEAVEAT